MFDWLADNANVLFLLLALAALCVVAAWWMTRQSKYLLGLIPIVVLAVGVWLLARFVDTDQKRLRRIVEAMAQGVRQGNDKLIFQHISKSFKFRNMGLDDFRPYVQRHLRDGRATDVTVSKFAFPEISRGQGKAGKAQVEFWAHTEEAQGGPIRCEAEFVLEDDVWRMKKFELFIGNTTNVWPIP